MENYEPRAEDYDFICPILNEVFRDPVKAEDRKNTSFIMAYLTNSWGRLAYTRPWLIKASREFHVPLDQWIGHLPSLQKTLYTRCMILSCVFACVFVLYVHQYICIYVHVLVYAHDSSFFAWNVLMSVYMCVYSWCVVSLYMWPVCICVFNYVHMYLCLYVYIWCVGQSCLHVLLNHVHL